jgi:predicted membrane chloride channel (bestrophin family)
LARNIVEDASVILSLKIYFCQCCGMQLRGSPAEREYKEKLDKERKRKLRIVLRPPWLHD